jgi:glycosyltransferase involved in cell wall biosynthesis
LQATNEMASHPQPTSTNADLFVIVAAYNEAERIAVTLAALAGSFPGASVWVADDCSRDGTAALAEAAGAEVVRNEQGTSARNGVAGKGAAVTRAARAALASVGADGEAVVLLCDGDLGDSAARLGPLVEAVRAGDTDLAVAAFQRRVGGGVGLAVGFARWAIQRRCGLALRAPISGQRAMRAKLLVQVLPFAAGFGMEIGMTIDAARAGARVEEVDLDISHRATGRTLGGFLHRGRQLIDFVRVYAARR